ncbi:MAG: hypothetical protein N2691_02625 [Patescibacteria group bacterium]|nr:hypothetical protein [Patescibacteria group bacterium]
MGIKPLDRELEELARGRRREPRDTKEDEAGNQPRPVVTNALPKALFLLALILAGSFTYYFSELNRAEVERKIAAANARPRPTLGLILEQTAPALATPTGANRGTAGQAGERSISSQSTHTPEPAATGESTGSAHESGFEPTATSTFARLQTEGVKLVDAGFRQAQEVGESVLGVSVEQVQKTASESASQLQKTIYKETVGRIIQMLLDQLPEDSRKELIRKLHKENIPEQAQTPAVPPPPTPTPTAGASVPSF